MAAAVLPFRAQRAGKTALQWHVLRRESHAAGLPIECARCERPHQAPPALGRCSCGNFTFTVRVQPNAGQLPLGLELDVHAGEA
jgi:hypothetical protein